MLFLSNPPGITAERRRAMLDDVAALNRLKLDEYQDPEIAGAHRPVRNGLPHADGGAGAGRPVARSRRHVFERYGPESQKPGTFAANCLLARRLAERGVRFIQLYHRGWDQHGDLPSGITQPVLRHRPAHRRAGRTTSKQRGLLDDTLVIWGGEFGRTVYSPGRAHRRRTTAATITRAASASGWPAAASSAGIVYGETDDFCYNIVSDPVHVHDLNATILHLLGIDHTRLTYRYQGRDYRLTDVHGEVVKGVLA